MELFFLGTGAGIPAKLRNVTSIALLMYEERNAIWLFDCGEGTQHQILKTKIKPGKIEKIFITHMHGDHIFGLPGLLSSRSFQGGTSPVDIYGPPGIKNFIETCLVTSSSHLRYDIHIHEIASGQVFEDSQFTVESHLLQHGIDSYGYRIVQKEQPGRLDVERLKSMGIPSGPIYQQIKMGEVVTLPDGTVIDGKEYTLEPKIGKIIAIAGDTKHCENSILLAQDANILVHEATFQQGQEDLAQSFFHSTNFETATIAKRAGVKQLIMTHISSRFSEADMAAFVEEARSIFPNTEVASDFSSYIIE